MCVSGAVPARPVLDEHALDALAWNVREGMLVNERHLCILRVVRESGAVTS